MTMHVIFDDTAIVSPDLRAFIGVDRFGSLIFQRQSRADSMRELAGRVGAHFVHLKDAADKHEFSETLREVDRGGTFLFCAAQFVPTSDLDVLSTFLKQLQYVPTAIHVPVEGGGDRRGWVLMKASLLAQLMLRQAEGDVTGFFDQYGDAFVEVRDRVRLVDVSDERTLLEFLSGQFDVRHFNAIVNNEYTVTKRSKNREKIKREYEFYRLVPPEMQMFLVQPFDFEDDGATAGYKMERLSVPDMALQWMHSSFRPAEFERFLAHVFHFFSIRPVLNVAKERARAVQRDLYVEKVSSRLAKLKDADEYRVLMPLFERGFGGVDVLMERYMAMWKRMHSRFPAKTLVVGHGDPCFSNILYAKSHQILKLIDPRGADSEEVLYTDPYYDIAKLSHSVVGNYDFINLGRFDIRVDERLRLQLQIEGVPAHWPVEMFRRHVEAAGYDFELVRLCEASLFISMMPLHIDRPRQVLGFAINASNILDDLAGRREASA